MQPEAKEKDDPAALRRGLNERFRAPLMAYFMRRVGNQSEAEDLTQEAFTRLIGSASFAVADNRPTPEGANAYVFSVASNLLRDRQRKGARWRMHSISGQESAPGTEAIKEFVEDRNPERVLMGKESLQEVLGCLNELDERTKSIFMLFRLGGMKQKDIADLYDISVSMVEKSVIAVSVRLAKRFERKAP